MRNETAAPAWLRDPSRLPRRITVLSGGVGGAKFARGLRHFLEKTAPEVAGTPTPTVTCVVNTGDDMWMHGLRICPDLDSLMYGLAGVNDLARGWGRADESERVSAELLAYGVGVDWFTLGDLDLATHIARTRMLNDGMGLAEVTRALSTRWDLGATLLPATEHEVETRVQVGEGPEETLHFEEWWVRHRAALPARRFIHHRASAAVPAPGVLEAIETADLILFAPSNPVVSIGAILAIPGVREALRAATAPVIGFSPVIGASHVLGMAAQCLTAIGVEVSAAGVAEHYEPSHAQGGLLDGWLVDTRDADSVARIEAAGIPAVAVPLLMDSDALTADMVEAALTLARRQVCVEHREPQAHPSVDPALRDPWVQGNTNTSHGCINVTDEGAS